MLTCQRQVSRRSPHTRLRRRGRSPFPGGHIWLRMRGRVCAIMGLWRVSSAGHEQPIGHRPGNAKETVMTFTPGKFANFIAGRDPVYDRVSPSYTGSSTEFDFIIVGSGMGGGVLADALADRFGMTKRIL